MKKSHSVALLSDRPAPAGGEFGEPRLHSRLLQTLAVCGGTHASAREHHRCVSILTPRTLASLCARVSIVIGARTRGAAVPSPSTQPDPRSRPSSRRRPATAMIYQTDSNLFRSFLKTAAGGGSGAHQKTRAGPGEKSSVNKPVMND